MNSTLRYLNCHQRLLRKVVQFFKSDQDVSKTRERARAAVVLILDRIRHRESNPVLWTNEAENVHDMEAQLYSVIILGKAARDEILEGITRSFLPYFSMMNAIRVLHRCIGFGYSFSWFDEEVDDYVKRGLIGFMEAVLAGCLDQNSHQFLHVAVLSLRQRVQMQLSFEGFLREAFNAFRTAALGATTTDIENYDQVQESDFVF